MKLILIIIVGLLTSSVTFAQNLTPAQVKEILSQDFSKPLSRWQTEALAAERVVPATPSRMGAVIARLEKEAVEDAAAYLLQKTGPNVFLTLGILGRPLKTGIYWDPHLETVWKDGMARAAMYPDGYVEVLGIAFDAAAVGTGKVSPQALVAIEASARRSNLPRPKLEAALAVAETAARDFLVYRGALDGDISIEIGLE